MLASIRVKFASTLQVAPWFNVNVAFNVPSFDVNDIALAVLVPLQLKAVVIVYVTEFTSVTAIAAVAVLANVPVLNPAVPANITDVVPFKFIVVALSNEFMVCVIDMPEKVMVPQVIPLVSNVSAAGIESVEETVIVPDVHFKVPALIADVAENVELPAKLVMPVT